jgi:hypothetical protein
LEEQNAIVEQINHEAAIIKSILAMAKKREKEAKKIVNNIWNE